jgi:hypothetical protein
MIDFNDPRTWIVGLYVLMLIGIVGVWLWSRWRR